MAVVVTAAGTAGLAILGKITEFTVKPVGRQLGYICFYHRNMADLDNNIGKLQAARDTVQDSIDVATRNVEDIAADVRHWLRKVDKILQHAETFKNDQRHAEAGCCTKWYCSNLRLRHQLGRKAKKLIIEISDLYVERETINTISHPKDPQQLISLATTGYQSYNSRESNLKKIMDDLTSTDVNLIGVHGMPGVGKTTLVAEVAKRAKAENLFDEVVSAEVKRNPDIKQVQKQIADMLGLKLEDEHERTRAARLLDRFKNERSILVILDDLWDGIDLNILGIPFGDDHQKGPKKLMSAKDRGGA
ncbi:Disease resistance protein [Quillaja saponaria]|uniref:Disease resistance protein n=1 Tax=Quillaja saponaria TaxID=32244 RepID=A0AAD7VK86_QUISA|nr:Disease resistance protein [Quillaja saponaria]